MLPLLIVSCLGCLLVGLILGLLVMWWWRRRERQLWLRYLQALIPRDKLPIRNTTYSIHEAIFTRPRCRQRRR